ncbi:uncharacterized protein LOC110825837 isoform X2 [Carica papaya]|uniref:uncharacterized protein LOC110825837 isoform X2 n=1 Tax=Carica papaya TaxID=3649 RepID=UPI000B8C88AC|nr:uncharacterized protein LOC110825837 isoform X2 [Carica papaya]
MAMSAANLILFPAQFRAKPEPETYFSILHSLPPLQFTRDRKGNSVATFKDNDRVLLTKPFANPRDHKDCFVDLRDNKGWIHFVGIGGCGLSALAMLALKQGFEVSGSDIAWSSYMDGLQEAGALLHVGHSVSNIHGGKGSRLPKAIVVSSAIPQDNVEISHAKFLGIPVYKRDYWLTRLTENYNLIAIAGTHGKSTTAGMLAYVLNRMGDDITAVVGAQVKQFPGGNIMLGGGKNFVLEADEYDGCFLGLSPYIAVVTNLEWEHVDIFPDEEAVKKVFRRFLKQISNHGHLIVCGDSLGAYSFLDHIKRETKSEDSCSTVSVSGPCSGGYRITTYGISNTNEWHASSICLNSQGGNDYMVCHRGLPLANISLQIPGVHNVLNSLAVIATVSLLYGDQRNIHESVHFVKSHLHNFIGISRRFEMIGKIHGCHIYDDYAHHPTEVHAVLQAARQKFPQMVLLVVFQPHTYSRLAALKDDFATALSSADQVVVTKVYAARETDKWGVSGMDLATSIIGPPSEYIPSLVSVIDKLVIQICKDPHCETVILTLGAGDITHVGPNLLGELKRRLQIRSS